MDASGPSMVIREDGITVALNFKLSANPKPMALLFFLVKKEFPDFKIRPERVQVTELDRSAFDRIFEVSMICRVERSGKYILRYVTRYINASCDPFDIVGISGKEWSHARTKSTLKDLSKSH